MKITITYRTSKQISPDGFREYTEVVHLQSTWTLERVFFHVAKRCKFPPKKASWEIHFDLTEECKNCGGEIHSTCGCDLQTTVLSQLENEERE